MIEKFANAFVGAAAAFFLSNIAFANTYEFKDSADPIQFDLFITTNGDALKQAKIIAGVTGEISTGTVSSYLQDSQGKYASFLAGTSPSQAFPDGLLIFTADGSTEWYFYNGYLTQYASINSNLIARTVTFSKAAIVNTVVASVPEPETYAMMLAGLALVGFTARLSKR